MQLISITAKSFQDEKSDQGPQWPKEETDKKYSSKE
jgi:hypothetical protein